MQTLFQNCPKKEEEDKVKWFWVMLVHSGLSSLTKGLMKAIQDLSKDL